MKKLKKMFIIKTSFKGKNVFYKSMCDNGGQRSFWIDNIKYCKVFDNKEDTAYITYLLKMNEKINKSEITNLYEELLSSYSNKAYEYWK